MIGFLTFVAFMTMLNPALAQDVSTITKNIIKSTKEMPALVSAFCYLVGLLFGVSGILKLKAHVENPGEGGGQTPLRTPVIRLCVGGMMFALPALYEAIANTIGGDSTGAAPVINAMLISGMVGINPPQIGINFNTVLANIVVSARNIPNLISAFAYLLGLVIGAMGAIKLKEHVESPEQVTLKEPVIRFLAAGALFSLPTVYSAMFQTIDGGNASLLTTVSSLFKLSSISFSAYAQGSCSAAGADAGSFLCGILANANLFPAFLTLVAYIFGLVMGVWGILKVRDHVLNPQQTQLMEGVSRFIAGGCFFALPAVVAVLSNTVSNFNILGFGLPKKSPITSAGYNEGSYTAGSCGTTQGLDGMLACFVNDIYGPMHSVLNLFAFIAGMIFIMIGISRLLKSAQEGAKGPGGIGTIMTFVMGGALISYNEIIRAMTTTLTGAKATKAYGVLQYTTGMTQAELDAAHAVITAIIKFMIIVGLISFVRGLFIVRDVAEGSQQASMMAGMTHIIGGTLAINLGPLLVAIQTTLGLTQYGIKFL